MNKEKSFLSVLFIYAFLAFKVPSGMAQCHMEVYEYYDPVTQTFSYTNARDLSGDDDLEIVYEGQTLYYYTGGGGSCTPATLTVNPGVGGTVTKYMYFGSEIAKVTWGAASGGSGSIFAAGRYPNWITVEIGKCGNGNIDGAYSAFNGSTVSGSLTFPAAVNAGDIVYYQQRTPIYAPFYFPMGGGAPTAVVTGGTLLGMVTDTYGNKYAKVEWGTAGTGNIKFTGGGLCPSSGANITITTPQAIFDGIDDRITIPNNTNYNLGSGNFTIEGWIKASSVQNSPEATIFSKCTGPSDGIWFGLNASGELSAKYIGLSNAWSDGIDLRDNTWHHVALIRSSRDVSYYLDGIQVGGSRAAAGTGTNISTNANVWIGDVYPGAEYAFTGSMKGIRIWNIARTDEDLLNTWKTNLNKFTVNMIGYWDMNDIATQVQSDRSNTANNGYLGSNSTAADSKDPALSLVSSVPFVINALSFDGNDDRVKINDDATNHNFGTGNFTIEAYVYAKSWLNDQTIYSKRTSGSDGVWFGLNGSGVPVLKLNGETFTSTITDLRDAGWKHIAVTKSGNTISFYAESSSSPQGTGTYVSGTTTTTTAPIWIGNDIVASKGFNGYIDEVRIWNIARTGADINGQKTATAISGLTQTTNLKGWWRFNASIGQIDNDLSSVNKSAYLGDADNAVEITDPLRIANQAFAGAKYGTSAPKSGASHKGMSVAAQPNPFTETVLLTPSELASENALVVVTDITGTEVYRTTMPSGEESISLGSSLSSGMYIVTITDAYSVRTVKIIKK